MRVLMLGWEFPPFISGGLGTACYGLTRALNQLGVEILFVLPRPVDSSFSSHVKLVAPRAGNAPSDAADAGYEVAGLERVRVRTIDALLTPYQQAATYAERRKALWRQSVAKDAPKKPTHPAAAPTPRQDAHQATSGFLGPVGRSAEYGGDMFSEVERYARLVAQVAAGETFDVIHAHDWMTYPAGLAVAGLTGKPLVVHVHSTEFDRSGEHVNQRIYDIERQGVHGAARVVAVSHLTRNILLSRYACPAERAEVIYNAVENGARTPMPESIPPIRRDEKIVLFLGRITMQKGPEYFLAAARKVLDVMPHVRFLMAGSGDMVRRTIEMAAEMGIGHKVLFTGFLRGGDVERVFRMADLYVMPSVSEPFGIAPLEALSYDVPVIISKQSGVAEVLTHVLKVDFWDIDEMANKIIAVLRHPPLQATLRQHGSFEVRKFSWVDSARQCAQVYRGLSPATCGAT